MARLTMTPTVAEGRPGVRPPVVSFVGYSGSGKTTVLERLVPVLRRRGWRVAVIKHVHHKGFELDKPGKDSHRLTQAGADIVLLSSPERIALLEETPQEWELQRLISLVQGRVDLVLTEGYRGNDAPHVAVGALPPGLDPETARIVAVVSDSANVGALPCFKFDEPEPLAAWLEQFCGFQGDP